MKTTKSTRYFMFFDGHKISMYDRILMTTFSIAHSLCFKPTELKHW